MQRLLRALSLSVDDHLLALDSMGTVVFADDEVLAFLGRGREDLGRLHLSDVLAPPDLAWFARVVGRLFADAPVTMPQGLLARGASGAAVDVLVTAWRFNRPDGHVFVIALLRPQGACAALAAA
jgi:hypothetical protein